MLLGVNPAVFEDAGDQKAKASMSVTDLKKAQMDKELKRPALGFDKEKTIKLI